MALPFEYVYSFKHSVTVVGTVETGGEPGGNRGQITFLQSNVTVEAPGAGLSFAHPESP